jgi:hypothetical protein
VRATSRSRSGSRFDITVVPARLLDAASAVAGGVTKSGGHRRGRRAAWRMERAGSFRSIPAVVLHGPVHTRRKSGRGPASTSARRRPVRLGRRGRGDTIRDTKPTTAARAGRHAHAVRTSTSDRRAGAARRARNVGENHADGNRQLRGGRGRGGRRGRPAGDGAADAAGCSPASSTCPT